MADVGDRPAFYALRPGGWRDIVTILHPPYTAWHLSYVAIGAAAAPTVHADRVGAAIGAFFLAVGVGAHALDALTGYWVNALSLRPSGVLVAIACLGLSTAQRALSTPARELRRRTVSVEGE